MGCVTSEILRDPQERSKYGPSGGEPSVGIVKYKRNIFAESNREDAYEQMYHACHRKYKILSEGPRSEGGTIVPLGNTAVVKSNEYWYITFQCEK